jgi:hypothetical protein
MKKFGTPIGAGPGNDSEKVGLAAVGTPSPVGKFVVDWCFDACLCFEPYFESCLRLVACLGLSFFLFG